MDLTKATTEYLKRSFYFFVRYFWNEVITEPFSDNWHIKYLCDELQLIGERVASRLNNEYDLIINIPPGMTKSTVATVMFPVWVWLKDAKLRTLTASYSKQLSIDHSVKSRDIIRSHKFKKHFPELAIRQDFDNKSHYKNRPGGERFATSVGGTVTGMHAHLLIIDDPLSPKQASSEVERKKANSFFTNTLPTRKVNKSVSATILIMQRLHEDDPTGHLLKTRERGAKIKHICLPGTVADNIMPTHLSEFYRNGLLDAKRLNNDDITLLKTNLGSYQFAGQIMQKPAPEKGGIWERWFVPISRKDIPSLERLGSDWDLAYTSKKDNSASAYVTAGVKDNKMYITDANFNWLEFPALIKYMKSRTAPHYIEAKASGKSAKQTLSDAGIPAIEVDVEGDKITKTRMVTPYAEAGMIFVAEDLLNRIYNDDKQGILSFPNSTNNDLNDALCQAIKRLLQDNEFFTF